MQLHTTLKPMPKPFHSLNNVQNLSLKRTSNLDISDERDTFSDNSEQLMSSSSNNQSQEDISSDSGKIKMGEKIK